MEKYLLQARFPSYFILFDALKSISKFPERIFKMPRSEIYLIN